MAPYIDLDQAIMHLRCDCMTRYPISYSNGISTAIKELKKLPTADVVPKSEVNEIIGTFEVLLYKHYNGDITEREFYRLFAELKKKYREG